MAQSLRIERLSGKAIEPFLPELARLRITVFREFPYLYDGSQDYEEKYLATYVDVPDSVMVLVWDGATVVGASSGLPMAVETPETLQPFPAHGYDPEPIFYYGESVLLPAYRGRGLGKRFFEEREAHARALQRFDLLCFCAVERPSNHPRRPADYVPLDAFWNRRGFIKHPELHTTFTWRELDEATESPKPMVFWLKPLAK
ncbi:MAG: GNAT family N-acetyltransferase [Candidatus Competibacteraceae bacterium]